MSRVEVTAECVELPLPEHPVLRDPGGGLLERARQQAEDVPSPLAPAFEKARAFEHPQVPRNGGQRDVHRFGEDTG